MSEQSNKKLQDSMCFALFFSPRQAQGYCVALRTLEGKHGPGRAQQSSQLNIQVDGKQGVEHTASEGRTPCSCCRGTGANSLQGG